MSDDRASVRIVDVFDAPRDVVFAAWTEPERLKQWWGPGFFETVFAEVDLRPGGRYELLLEPGSMRLVGEFREVNHRGGWSTRGAGSKGCPTRGSRW